jgi:hypothetical protein
MLEVGPTPQNSLYKCQNMKIIQDMVTRVVTSSPQGHGEGLQRPHVIIKECKQGENHHQVPCHIMWCPSGSKPQHLHQTLA